MSLILPFLSSMIFFTIARPMPVLSVSCFSRSVWNILNILINKKSLWNRGFFYKTLFKLSDLIRRIVSRLPGKLKHFVCDVLAIIFYMPFILAGRSFKLLGFRSFAKKMPLHGYQNRSFFMIRNDTLHRFGTRLEKRFS